MKIAMLGANGQLGSDVVEVLGTGFPVVALAEGDFDARDRLVIDKLRNKIADCSVVINCVAYTNVDKAESESDIAMEINAVFPERLADFCFAEKKILFHISTDYVFSGDTNRPYNETDSPSPVNVYGISKLKGEEAVSKMGENYFIFRTAGLFGKRGAAGKGGNFINTMIRLSRERGEVRVVNDQFTSPTHSLDVARVIRHFIEKDIMDFGIFHVVSSGYCSWYELADYVISLVGIDAQVIPVSSDEFKTDAKRPLFSALDNAKLSAIYKMPHWRDAVYEYLCRIGAIERRRDG